MSDARWKVGDVTVTMAIESHTVMGLGDFLPTASPGALAAHRGWLHPWAVDDDGQLKFVIKAVCLEIGGRKIVVDTCVGPRQLPEVYAFVMNDGSFINVLTEAGFGRDDVDLVICTHLHFDHIGWNTIREGDRWVPTFRKARYIVARSEHEHWMATNDDEKAMSNCFNLGDAVNPLFEAGVVDLVDTNQRISDEIRLVHTPGHTPAHASVSITSQGERAFITGDCAHHPVQLAEPDWYTLADGDPEQSSATRRRVVAEYADKPVLVIGTHFPPPGVGHLVTTDGGVQFRPEAG